MQFGSMQTRVEPGSSARTLTGLREQSGIVMRGEANTPVNAAPFSTSAGSGLSGGRTVAKRLPVARRPKPKDAADAKKDEEKP